MTLFKDKYRIESIRRPNWDYSCPAVYFITFCVQDRAQILGNIVNGAMHLSELGNIVESEILKSIEIRKQWIFHTWVVMPDHVHFLIEILPVETDHLNRLNVETDCSLSLLHGNSTIPQSNNSAQPNNILNVETDRLNVETDRLNVETDRLNVETDRLNVETDRLNVETDRLNVETDRLNVETDCSLSLHDNSTIPQSNNSAQPNNILNVETDRLNVETDCSLSLHGNSTIPQSNNQLIPKRAKKSISSFVAIFKALTTKQINELAGWVDAKIWQSNYYDKIIKQPDEFEQTYHYINNNPALWSDKQL